MQVKILWHSGYLMIAFLYRDSYKSTS
jgi:hypothetical protein